jgi:hypothetical protein
VLSCALREERRSDSHYKRHSTSVQERDECEMHKRAVARVKCITLQVCEYSLGVSYSRCKSFVTPGFTSCFRLLYILMSVPRICSGMSCPPRLTWLLMPGFRPIGNGL